MDLNKSNEMRTKVLKTLEESYTKELIPAKLTEKDANGVEVLATIFDDLAIDGLESSGEFFFLPNKEGEEVMFFVNLITVSTELPESTLGELMAAVSIINTYILAGAFSIDPKAGALVFKHVHEMPMDLDEKTVTEYADLSMGIAISMVQQYGYYLIEVKEGTRTADNVAKALTSTL